MYSNSRGRPSCVVSLNGKVLTDLASCEDTNVVLEYNELELDDINFLHITHYDKKSNYTEVIDEKVVSDVAIEIGKIEIDGIQVPEKYLWSQWFFPNWSFPPNPKMPMIQNRYLGFNGTWQFVFIKNYKDFIVSHYILDKFL
jgi:hypothetical protein